MSTATLTAEPWRLVSGIDPAKPIVAGQIVQAELPAAPCRPHCCIPKERERKQCGESWYATVVACYISHPGACQQQVECPDPEAPAVWEPGLTERELLERGIRKARLGVTGCLAAPEVTKKSEKVWYAKQLRTKLEWLAHLRHKEIHMAARVQSCG